MIKNNESLPVKELLTDKKVKNIGRSEVMKIVNRTFKEGIQEYLTSDEILSSLEIHLTRGSKGRRR